MLKSDIKNHEITYRKGVMDKENIKRLMIRAKKLVTETAKHIIFEQSEFDKQK